MNNGMPEKTPMVDIIGLALIVFFCNLSPKPPKMIEKTPPIENNPAIRFPTSVEDPSENPCAVTL
jgi:hypothetical protein